MILVGMLVGRMSLLFAASALMGQSICKSMLFPIFFFFFKFLPMNWLFFYLYVEIPNLHLIYCLLVIACA